MNGRLLFFASGLLLLLLLGCSSATPPVRLIALGDILLDKTPGQRLAIVGADRFFGPFRSVLQQGDAVFANLETPAARNPRLRTDKPADLTFTADPERLRDLAWAGVSVVSLANNHMDDGGESAILETLRELDGVGIAHAGAGANDKAAHRPALLVLHGYRIAVLAYNHVFTGLGPAGPERAGIAWADPTQVQGDIARAKSEWHADIVIVSVHWGNEFDTLPTNFQYQFGRQCINSGATVVLGHHPHVVQGLELYRGGLIAYSLGNAVFSMPDEETSQSIALQVELGDTGLKNIVCIPIVIDRWLGAPRPAEGEVRERVLDRLRSRSPGLVIGTDGRVVSGGTP